MVNRYETVFIVTPVLSEDQMKDEEDNIQKATDKFIAEIDKMVDVKTKELMTV